MTVVAEDEGVVLVVGSGGQVYREYLLAGAAERRPAWLLDRAASTWQRPYARGTTVVPLLDTVRLVPDRDALVAAAVEVARDRRVVGALSYDETLVMTAAHIAERLGLRGLTVEGADRCRNKHRTRLALTAAGLPQPRFDYAATLPEAEAAASRIGFPLVLKPRGMGASIGVVRATGPDDLAAAFAVAERASHGGSPSYEGGVLVEELVSGPEISVDGAVFDGEYRPFFLARKRVGLAPYFEEIGHVLDADDPLLEDEELLRVLEAAHRTLGLGYGTTHTEVLLAERGPVIVEVNARLGGDLIPYLGKLATGIDPAHVAVDVATGRRPDLTRRSSGCAGIRFLYPPVEGRVLAVSLPAPGAVDGLVEARAMVEPGRELLLPPRAHLGRYGYVLCRADDAAVCEDRLDRAEALARLDLAPFDGPPVA
jgi:biotin carboxylase